MSTEFELFKGTNFSDLMRDIYHNSKKKSRQIDSLIKNLEPMIKNTGDATVIVPMIKDYIEVSVKNDDALVKLAAICQRIISAGSKDDDGNEYGLTDDERARLLEEAEAEIEKLTPKEPTDGNDRLGHSDSTGSADRKADPIR
tara:strand:- start:676 stop:1104 length:429 start_codon:yes stop_codon:yes gene_type:complete